MLEWKTLASGILVDVIWLMNAQPSTGPVVLLSYSSSTSSDKEHHGDLILQIPNRLNIWHRVHSKTD